MPNGRDGSSTFARAASSSLVSRRKGASLMGWTSFCTIESTIFPASLPLYLSKSPSFEITAAMGSAVTIPFVPGVQANGNPIKGWYCGSCRCAAKRV